MKKVLIITYYFPPLGGAGVQRTLKFVKYLSEFHYIPVILTPNPKLVRYVSDYDLIKEIPSRTKIYKSFIIDLNWFFKILYGLKLIKIVNYINGTLLFPDYQIQWLPFAKLKIKKIMKKEKIDIVYITSPPHSIHLLGKWIKNKYQVPVIVDFRDPLTFNYEKKKTDFFNKCFDFEKGILVNADYVIANTAINKQKYVEKFHIPENKISVVTNGFDQNDFENIKIEKVEDRKIIFSHIGRFYSDYNAYPLLHALSKIKCKINNVEFRFIGGLTYQDKKIVQKLKLDNVIKIIDYCSHSRTLEYSRTSDFLILILANENWDYWIPGKTFEYINSGRKILAIVPQNGCCAEIIRNTRTGEIVSPDKIDKIAELILYYIENYQKVKFDPDFEEIQKYERRYLTKKLALVFDKILKNNRS